MLCSVRYSKEASRVGLPKRINTCSVCKYSSPAGERLEPAIGSARNVRVKQCNISESVCKRERERERVGSTLLLDGWMSGIIIIIVSVQRLRCYDSHQASDQIDQIVKLTSTYLLLLKLRRDMR